ncbi:MAG: hypothetical protein QM756_03780 [Polyangiaceae bacterium]
MSPSSGCVALASLLWASALFAQPAPAAPPEVVPVPVPPPSAPVEAAPAPAAPEPAPAAPPAPIVITPPALAPTPAAEPVVTPAPAPPAPLPPAPSVPAAPVRDSAPAVVRPGPPRSSHDFNLELGLGLNGRLGDASGYSHDEGLGARYGLGFYFTLSDAIALGLELSRADLGRASAQTGQNFVQAEYASSAALLSGRFVAYQNQSLRLFAALRVGLALEHVAASGVRVQGTPLEPATSFDCSGSAGPAMAIGAGVGGLVHLNESLDFVSRLDVHADQLTSDVVGGCAAGVGSGTSLSLGVGLAYGFDGPRYSGDPFAGRERTIGSR